MKTLIPILFLMPIPSFAYNLISIQITYPDKEVKNYTFIPSEKERGMKLKVPEKFECYLGASQLPEETKFSAIDVECWNGKLAIGSTTICGSPGIIKLQDGKVKSGKHKLTSILVKCE